MAKLRVPDLCIDLGTSRTRIGVRGQGVAVDVPTVVAMRGREVVAIGDEAVQMSGRVPSGLDVVRPIRDTEVTDFAATERLVGSVLRVATSARRKPRVLALLPSGATEVQRRATLESLRAAGARDVVGVDAGLAAAIGAGLPILDPIGSLVVDLGAGGSRAMITSLGGCVVQRITSAGGDAIRAAIATWLRSNRGLIVGDATTENLKLHVCDAAARTLRQTRIRGRDATGQPREEAVGTSDLAHAISEPVQQIREAVLDLLRHASPQLSSDILDRGMILCGGASQLRGMDTLLRDDTGLPVLQTDAPEHCVLRGGLALLDDPELFAHLVAA